MAGILAAEFSDKLVLQILSIMLLVKLFYAVVACLCVRLFPCRWSVSLRMLLLQIPNEHIFLFAFHRKLCNFRKDEGKV
jgi:hypothetical protein